MKFFFKFLFLLVCSITSNFLYAFDVYGFIPWSLKSDNTLISNQSDVKTILNQNGIKQIDVVYHNRMLTNGEVDSDKIQKIALESQKNPTVPISFDLEIGNKHKPETILPKLTEVIDLYHAYGGKAPIGVYATLPQNTFGGAKLTDKRKAELIELNKQYEIVAKKVNFLSPVLYFYDGDNFDAWKQSVNFSISESKKFASKYDLKIYPYITNSFRIGSKDPITNGWTINLLESKQMYDALDYLKQQRVDGVILWASSQVVTIQGRQPTIEFNQPWFMGLTKFMRANR